MAFPSVFFGTLREHYILLFGAAGAFGLATGFVGSWIGAHLAARRAMKAARSELTAQQAVQLQLTPILQALDAISVEVERISEAQRFTAKVLLERGEQRTLIKSRSEPRSITPH
ncbi:MAG: hypothetical protein ABIY52_05495 [Gemmatimonadaceae bacterium]